MSVTEAQVIEYLEGLNIIQLNDLVKKLEEKWDVKAASGGVVMAAAGPAAAPAEAPVEPTEFNVILADFGANKINVIKELRAITGLGLKEAKDLVDGVPSTIKEAIAKEQANEMKTKLEAAGAKVEIKAVG
jgi:large subunit ribosomal protein L7/L12